MATPDGSVLFEIDGEQKLLRLDIARLCLLEEALGRGPVTIALEFDHDPRLATATAIIWAALGEAKLTLAAVRTQVAQRGAAEIIQTARDVFMAAFPKAEGGKPAGEANPPMAAAG